MYACSTACCTYTQQQAAFYHICLSLRPAVSLSLTLCIFKSATHLSPECRSRVCRLTLLLISFPLHPLSLFCASFPLASALFIPPPLMPFVSFVIAFISQFSFLPAAARSFLSHLSTFGFHFTSYAYRCTIFSFFI